MFYQACTIVLSLSCLLFVLGIRRTKGISGILKMLFSAVSSRCNGHLQSGTGAGTATGSAPRANGDCRGPGRKSEGDATSDLFSEMNLTEIQKLKQQLLTVSLISDQPHTL